MGTDDYVAAVVVGRWIPFLQIESGMLEQSSAKISIQCTRQQMAGDEEVEEVAESLYIDDCSKDSENS